MAKDKHIKGIKQTAKSVISRGEKALFASVGALARVEEEGRGLLANEKSKLMDQLIGEGRKIVSRGSKSAKLDRIQDAVSDSFDKARRQVADAYDKVVDQVDSSTSSDDIDALLDERVVAILARLGYPSAEDYAELSQRVDELSARLAEAEGKVR